VPLVNGSPHFALFGIPVRVEPTFLLLMLWLGFGGDAQFMVVMAVTVFVGVLVHELGHALAYRAYGARPSIVLWGLGGLTYGPANLSPGRHVLVSLAGPLAGVALLGAPAWYLRTSGAVTDRAALEALDVVIWVNVGWAIFNLLPILPLDGGNVVRDLVTVVTGRDGERPARYVSVVVAAAAAIWAVAVEEPFLALFAGLFAFMNVSALRSRPASFIHVERPPSRRAARDLERRRAAEGAPSADRLDSPNDLATGWAALTDGDPSAALEAADRVLGADPYPDVERRARELRGWALLQLGRAQDARHGLEQLPPGRKANRYLRAAVDAASGAGVEPLIDAFLFAGSGPDRQRAAVAAADAGLVDGLIAGLLREGEVGRGHAEDVARMLVDARPAATERIRAQLAR
jgi:Zn-dependent protease